MATFEKITFTTAQKRLKHRKDIKLIEKNYNGWTIKSEFYDLIQEEYFWSIPRYACKSDCCHPTRRKILNFQKNSFSFKEAKQKFINQGRTDIKLCEDGFFGWKKKSKFYDKIEEDYFFANPINVFNQKSCHPKRSLKNRVKKRTLPFFEAKTRLTHRKDLKLIEKNYNGWKVKSEFYDLIQKEYFWSIPYDVLKDNCCHPKRSFVIRGKKQILPFKEVRQKFINQGRKDIELIKEEYKGWRRKSKFYDKIQKDYFWASPYNVFIHKSCHPKRKSISKNQIELFQIINETFKNLEIKSEYTKIIEKKFYRVDILISSKNIIIEYNGDYWHCNPKLYNENYFHKKSKKFAKDIWKYDKQRKEELEKAGYKVLIVWEYDYRKDKEKVIKKLKAQISNFITS